MGPAENAGELSFKTGDIITTLEWVNEEWMVGRIGTREGMFPLGFVKIVDELPKAKGETAALKGVLESGCGRVKCDDRDYSCLSRSIRWASPTCTS